MKNIKNTLTLFLALACTESSVLPAGRYIFRATQAAQKVAARKIIAPSSFIPLIPLIPAAIATPMIPVYSAAPIQEPISYKLPRIDVFGKAQPNQVKNEKIEKKAAKQSFLKPIQEFNHPEFTSESTQTEQDTKCISPIIEENPTQYIPLKNETVLTGIIACTALAAATYVCITSYSKIMRILEYYKSKKPNQENDLAEEMKETQAEYKENEQSAQ